MEPMVAGKRLLLRKSIVISDEQYKINKDMLDQCVRNGTLTVESTMPFVPLNMPELPEGEADGAEVPEVPKEPSPDATIPAPAVHSHPATVQTSQATAQINPPPPGGNYPQRRDDKKRGR